MTMTLSTPTLPVSTPRSTIRQSVQDLASRLEGRVILPGDPDYEEARQVYNRSYSRFPAMIVQAASTDDVARAVRFARANELTLAVRSGGHGFAGQAVNNGGLVIDLRFMDGLSIDPERRIARAQPGVTSRKLGETAQQYGLALSTGDTSSVALGGLTLGGGIGWMVRKQGLTIDNLISAEMVTADGRVVRASAGENPDLFWAMRGGGGNFGIVTELEYQLHEVGTVYGGLIGLPLTREVLRAYSDYARNAPDELTTITMIMAAPQAPFVPEEVVGRPAVIVVACYAGDPSQGERVVEPIRAIANPLFEFLAPMPYVSIYDFTEEETKPGPFMARSLFLEDMPDDVLDSLVDAMAEAGPLSAIQLRPLGGRMAEIPEDATAFAHRKAGYMLAVLGIWEEGNPADAEVAWTQQVFDSLASRSSGVYVNFLQAEPSRVREAYPATTYRRLAEVKRIYDPANVFAGNVNIEAARL
jgi:FAD/FMN-containing dehydrogenase